MDIALNIRRLRRARGLTLDQLARLSGVSKGYLSKIENGKQIPAISTLQTIAAPLGTDISEFLDEVAKDTHPSRDLDIVKAGSGKGEPFASTGAGYAFRPLVKQFRNKHMSPFLMKIGKGETKSLHHDSEEFGYVVKGELELVYAGKRNHLRAGDSFYCDSRRPHSFVNASDTAVLIVAVNFNYRRF